MIGQRHQMVKEGLENAARYLPIQAPLESYIHQNTLQHFEGLRFEEACELVAKTRGAEPYLRHEELLKECERGRILESDLVPFLIKELQERGLDPDYSYGPKLNRLTLFLNASYVNLTFDSDSSYAWLRQNVVEDQELFDAIEQTFHSSLATMVRRKIKSEDPDVLKVDENMITLCSAFIDQGVALWPMPGREDGLWSSALHLIRQDFLLRKRLRAHSRHDSLLSELHGLSPLAAIEHLLGLITPHTEQWADIILDETISLPGWTGMMHVAEKRPFVLSSSPVKASLEDYLAVRLLLKYLFDAPSPFEVKTLTLSHTAMLMQIYRTLCRAGFVAADIKHVSASAWSSMTADLSNYDDLSRRRLLHYGYEHRYKLQFLTALRLKQADAVLEKPRFQALFCLDDREESTRRHLEAVAPDCETYGVAGFFDVDMLFVPGSSNDVSARCPLALVPSAIITERIKPQKENDADKIKRSLKRGALLRKWSLKYTRRLRSAPLTMSLGGLLSVPIMVSYIFRPVATVRMLKALQNRLLGSFKFDLNLVADAGARHDDVDAARIPARFVHLPRGFTYEQMAEKVQGLLTNSGLTRNFSDLVFVLAHGSTNANNPFWAAYACAACGGRNGDRNAKAFAWMANHPKVRHILAARGFHIPAQTFFVGGIHDTCTDIVEYTDPELLPERHFAQFDKAASDIKKACALNAKERTKRFNVSHNIKPEKALAHVFDRAHSYAEPRPEYGHSSNAVSIVGRRSLSRGVNLNRRALLTSYDPTQDDAQGKILETVLQGIIRVVSGVCFDYYFSRVDNRVFGCGSKLPHNVTSMVGVMDGHQSDLRNGMPWQSVEIHEPMRILMVLDQKTDVVLGIIERNPAWNNLFKNGWMQLICSDPETGLMSEYQRGTFATIAAEDRLQGGVL